MEHPVSEFKSKSGLKRVFDAFGYSMEGLKAAWRHEFAFRQEIIVAAIATVVALALPVSAFQKLMMIVVLLLVLLVELLNSAIEAVVDRISLDFHPLSKRAKDLGSAAVAMSLVIAGLTWAVILFTRFY
jgi:diacylglycerol kinase (ATP)